MRTVSATQFRLLCQEIAFKVNARQNREQATTASVLLELLRRVESYLGQRPVGLVGTGANLTKSMTDALDRFVEPGADTTWTAIADKELFGKVKLRDQPDPPEKPSKKKAARPSAD
jgi:hypothetical protein